MSEIPFDEEENVEPPSNFDVSLAGDEISEMEFDLPESEEFPPDELQGRLELPTTIVMTTDAAGNDVVAKLDPITPVGVEKVWSETEEMVNKEESSDLGVTSISGGQLQTEYGREAE